DVEDKGTLMGELFWETPWWGNEPELKQELRENFQQALKGEAVQFETCYYESGGEKRDLHATFHPVRDSSGNVEYVIPEGRDITEQKNIERQLERRRRDFEAISELFAETTLDEFYDRVVEGLADILHVDYAFVGTFPEENDRIAMESLWGRGEFRECITYHLAGTPCENVVGSDTCIYPVDVAEKFPEDKLLSEMEVEGYAGAPLFDSDGEPIGLLAVMNRQPLKEEDYIKQVLQIFARRTGNVFERRRKENELEETLQTLRETSVSRDYLREIIDTLPGGFFILDLQGQIKMMNRSLLKMLDFEREQLTD
ncbi:MAG: GAF domain-containing protein, partial [bacterium]